MDCIFCGIATGQIPGDILYQDEKVVAFRDINPQAPAHLLIIPRKHILSLQQLSAGDLPLISQMVAVANQLAQEEGVAFSGYRLVINCGTDGGQLMNHLHIHLLGGRQLAGELG